MLLDIVFCINSEQRLPTEHQKGENEVVVFSWSRIRCRSSLKKALCAVYNVREMLMLNGSETRLLWGQNTRFQALHL